MVIGGVLVDYILLNYAARIYIYSKYEMSSSYKDPSAGLHNVVIVMHGTFLFWQFFPMLPSYAS